MRFLTFVMVAAAVASANASIAQRRKISYTSETCSQDITKITEKTVLIENNVSNKLVNGLMSGLNFLSSFENLHIFQSFDVDFTNTIDYCCTRIGPNMSDEDTISILGYLSTMVDECNKLISTLISEKQIVDEDKRSIFTVELIIKSLNLHAISLLNCLSSKSPENLKPAIKALIDKTNMANSNAKAAYGF